MINPVYRFIVTNCKIKLFFFFLYAGFHLPVGPLLLFINSWSVGMVLDRNEGLVLSEFGR